MGTISSNITTSDLSESCKRERKYKDIVNSQSSFLRDRVIFLNEIKFDKNNYVAVITSNTFTNYILKILFEKEDYTRELVALNILQKFSFVPKIYDNFEHEGMYIIIMSKMKGISLYNWIKTKSIDEICIVYNKIQDQIKMVHEKGVTHGDPHDNNILVNEDDIYFIDFGMANMYNNNKQCLFSTKYNRSIQKDVSDFEYQKLLDYGIIYIGVFTIIFNNFVGEKDLQVRTSQYSKYFKLFNYDSYPAIIYIDTYPTKDLEETKVVIRDFGEYFVNLRDSSGHISP